MPSDGKEPDGEDLPSPEVQAPEVPIRTPHGSALSVKSEGGEDMVTMDTRGRLPQVTLPTSRESSVSPHDVSYDVGVPPTMATSSLRVAMDTQMSTQRRKHTGCSCCTCTGCGPLDGGRVLSTMYCVLVSILATVLPVKEGLQNSWLTQIPSAVFLGYLYGVSITFVIFVEIYLLRRAKRRRNKRRANKSDPEADDISQAGTKSVDSGGKNNLAYTSNQTLTGAPNGKPGGEMGEYGDSDTKSIKSEMSTMTELLMGDSDADLDQPLPHRISLFHRIALAVFALGFMIYLGLLLKQLHERHSPASCSATSAVWPHYVHLGFLLFQTFFIFKHAQVSLHSWQPVFRLGFLHMMATNWSVIVRALTRETLDSYLKSTLDASTPTIGVNVTMSPMADSSAYASCYVDEDILYKASPYLYPFILQYSLLAMAASYSLYADVGAYAIVEEPEKEPDTAERSEVERRRRMSYSQGPAVNFHKTHRGLFFGLIVMGATIVSIILFFSYLGHGGDDKGNMLAILIYYSSDLGLQVVIALVVWIGWLHTKRLSFVWPPLEVSVDEVLLLIALVGSVLYRLFRILSTFTTLTSGEMTTAPNVNVILTFTDLVVGVGLNLFQTSFVIDCFSRRSTSRRHLKYKPGRGSITFLLVANLALWAFRMFQFKQLQAESESQVEQAAYGFVVWTLVELSCIPLSIYYHYQVSASLARVWTDAYSKETVRESILSRREAEEQAESIMKSRSMDLHFLPRPSPIMRMIELRRRFRKRDEPEAESETVWSPVSDV